MIGRRAKGNDVAPSAVPAVRYSVVLICSMYVRYHAHSMSRLVRKRKTFVLLDLDNRSMI